MNEIKKIGCEFIWSQPYSFVNAVQDMLQEILINEETEYDGFLLFLSPEPVITLGKYSDSSNLLVSRSDLKRSGVSLYSTDRGGEITCHEPGQIVIYPIINLKKFRLKLKDYIHILECVVMDFLGQMGIKSVRYDERPGVWIGNDKIASLGISVKRHCTKHGVAINVNNSLRNFRFINPCGLKETGITSVKKQIKKEVDLKECSYSIMELFSKTFGVNVVETDLNKLLADITVQNSSFA